MAQLVQPIANGALVLSIDTDFDGCMKLIQVSQMHWCCTSEDLWEELQMPRILLLAFLWGLIGGGGRNGEQVEWPFTDQSGFAILI